MDFELTAEQREIQGLARKLNLLGDQMGDLEDLLLNVREQYGVTILFVTHDIDESVYLADRIAVLTHSPTEVKEVIAVDLPSPRDQIATKELPEFARLRAHVYRLIKRERPAPGDVEAEQALAAVHPES